MRAVLVLVLVGCVAGCGGSEDIFPPPDSEPEPWMDPPGDHGCENDRSCPTGEVCARAGGCMAAELVRTVHANWTLSGRPANRTTCASTPDLYIRFLVNDDLGPSYSPVPCSQGRFTIDKLPRTYARVELGVARADGVLNSGMLDEVTGEVTIDLPY